MLQESLNVAMELQWVSILVPVFNSIKENIKDLLCGPVGAISSFNLKELCAIRIVTDGNTVLYANNLEKH